MKQFNLKNKKIIFIVNPNSGKLSNINKNKIISDCFLIIQIFSQKMQMKHPK